jgi:hypothetical protein
MKNLWIALLFSVLLCGCNTANQASSSPVTTVTPTFTLSASPNTLSINQGSSSTSTITVTPQNGFTGSVTLSASGLPSGVTASFDPAASSSMSVLTVTVNNNAATGTAMMVTVTGTSGSLTHTALISIGINAAPPPVPSGPYGFTFTTSGCPTECAQIFLEVNFTQGSSTTMLPIFNTTPPTLNVGTYLNAFVWNAGVEGGLCSFASPTFTLQQTAFSLFDPADSQIPNTISGTITTQADGSISGTYSGNCGGGAADGTVAGAPLTAFLTGTYLNSNCGPCYEDSSYTFNVTEDSTNSTVSVSVSDQGAALCTTTGTIFGSGFLFSNQDCLFPSNNQPAGYVLYVPQQSGNAASLVLLGSGAPFGIATLGQPLAWMTEQ